MLSLNTAASLKTLLDGVVHDTAAEYARAVGTLTSEFVGRGGLHSSGFTLSVDLLAADALKQAADKLVEEAVIAHQAEPATDPSARAAQLAEALSSSLAATVAMLKDAKHERLKSIQGMPRGTALEESFATVSARALARLQIRVTALGNRQGPNITVNGTVGALQTGANSTASVVQTVYMPNSGDALAALERIEDAVRASQGMSATGEVLEMLQDLKEQTHREKPNPIKISSLIGGLGGVIQTIPNIAPAWETVVGWAAVVREAVSDLGGA